MKASLLSAHERLRKLQSLATCSEEEVEEEEEEEEEHSHGIMGLLSNEGRPAGAALVNKTSPQLVHTCTQSGTTTLKPHGSGSNVGMIGYESLVRYPQLIELAQTLLRKLGEVLSNIDSLRTDLEKRRKVLEVFWNEANALKAWLKTAKDQKKATLDNEV